MLTNPIPSNFQIVTSTKDVPSTSVCLERASTKNALILTNLTTLFGVQNEVILNEVFDLRLMSLFLVEHPLIMLNPNSSRSHAMEEMPNLHFLDVLLKNSLPQKALFPMKTIIMLGISLWGVAATPWAQGGPWSDAHSLWCHKWEDPSDPNVGEGPGR